MCIRDRSKPSYYFIDNSLCKEVLLHYFCDIKVFKFKYATVDGYKCFEAVFFRYNQQIGSITVDGDKITLTDGAVEGLSLIHICRCRRYAVCRSRWSPYH
eukprot:TRINITY_DN26205_c0_g1_i1.p2 TRINITY_DN26205_c0_g1~~TRINITY_DN26205_c0_g1_i1.p2  ORF type:complete len:100 (-),score=31.35 TRINITY_DN26205_c0_g1_i1:10-309(-)